MSPPAAEGAESLDGALAELGSLAPEGALSGEGRLPVPGSLEADGWLDVLGALALPGALCEVGAELCAVAASMDKPKPSEAEREMKQEREIPFITKHTRIPQFAIGKNPDHPISVHPSPKVLPKKPAINPYPVNLFLAVRYRQ